MAKAKAKPKAEETPDHPLARCRPRGDRVVVRRDRAKTQSEGGIYLPEASASKQQFGTVWAVGPGNYDASGDRIALGLNKGDRVVITGYAGLEVRDPLSSKTNDEEFIILRDEDILGILPG